MPAVRPKALRLASAIASSSTSNVCTLKNGTNSSSRLIRWSLGRPATTVGWT
jgi:hypothetical protein